MEKQANRSIKCSVDQCKHHCNGNNFCTLSSVNIGTHENHPTVCECVDCESFRVKD